MQSISVLNMAGHKDGKKDLIFTLWCGQIGGTPYTGPTYNGAIFFEQNSDGHCYLATVTVMHALTVFVYMIIASFIHICIFFYVVSIYISFWLRLHS